MRVHFLGLASRLAVRGTLAVLGMTALVVRVGAGNQCLDPYTIPPCVLTSTQNGQCCVNCYWPCTPTWNNCIQHTYYCNPPVNGRYYVIGDRYNCTNTGNTCTPN